MKNMLLKKKFHTQHLRQARKLTEIQKQRLTEGWIQGKMDGRTDEQISGQQKKNLIPKNSDKKKFFFQIFVDHHKYFC